MEAIIVKRNVEEKRKVTEMNRKRGRDSGAGEVEGNDVMIYIADDAVPGTGVRVGVVPGGEGIVMSVDGALKVKENSTLLVEGEGKQRKTEEEQEGT